MFDLETAMAAWRHSLEHNRAFDVDDVDELERHVRDQVAALVRQGRSEHDAFTRALSELGPHGEFEDEYRKVYWGKRRRRREVFREVALRIAMLKNYLKIALRTLRKQKGYALINVVGLTVGLACFILISLFVRFELSYDSFHAKADRIYRIVKEDPGNYYLGTNRFAVTSAPIVQALIDEFPEVEYAVQIEPQEVLFRLKDSRFYEYGLYATRHFFDVFSFELLQGDPRTALAEPGSVILTESLARKYFGAADPMGRTLQHVRGSDEGPVTVTGVAADSPPNSHLTFDYLLSMTTSSSYRRLLETDHWDSNNFRTYVSLHPGYDLPEFEAKLVALAQKYLGRYDYYQKNPDRISIYYPQALTDIHLHSHLNFELRANGDITYVYLFSAIGLLILLLASINYMNLATARSAMRAKEVGVRKVMGARRVQLVGQFMGEAVILSTVALGIALVLAFALRPVFNTLTAREMSMGWSDHPGFWLALVGLGLGVGLLSGSYPALMMSGFKPVGVMKGVLHRTTGKPALRNVLVVAQFTVTTALIVGTLVINRQLQYIQTANTGVDRDHVVSIEIQDRDVREQYAAVSDALMQHPNVLGVTGAWRSPTQIASQSGATSWESAEEGDHISVYHTPVQHGFVDLFGIELVEGRDFSQSVTADERQGMLINETMARQLGWETAVGKWFDFQGRELRIIGVMKDFNFLSFHQPMAPLALYLAREGDISSVFAKVRPERMQETIAHLEATMETFSPAYPFEYEFLDDAYDNMYQTEVRLGSLFSYFTVLALLIACLGLVGLAAFTSSRRTKEIGVRKVLGASMADVLVLLSKDFVKLVVLAVVLAAPPAYFAMRHWLEGFAYRIEVGPGILLLAGGMALAVALLTVSYQAIRAAVADPVSSLRYE